MDIWRNQYLPTHNTLPKHTQTHHINPEISVVPPLRTLPASANIHTCRMLERQITLANEIMIFMRNYEPYIY